MTSTRRALLAASLAALAASLTTGCGVWRFGSNNKITGGSTVTNTSLGVAYTIPHGFYQTKDESAAFGQVKDQSTTTKLATLWKEGTYEAGQRPSIDIQETVNPNSAPHSDTENPEKEALWWAGYGVGEPNSHIRRRSWDGPNLPGIEVSYEPALDDTRKGCSVAIVGYPKHRVVIYALRGGQPTYLPEVHDVAVSVKALTAASATPH